MTRCLAFIVCCCLAPAFAADAAGHTPVILISIDTLRADHLGAYGYRHLRTSAIDSFAQHGTLFTDADAQIPLTLPSHTSLFTSTYPCQNGIEENAERVPDGVVTLASVLRSHGYKTAAFIGSVFLEREMALDQGFDVYDSPFHFEAFSPLSGSVFFAGGSRNPAAVRDQRDGALVLAAAARWLAANRSQPVFAFVHLFDVHKPYQVPAGFRRTPGLSDYDAAIEYVDHLLGSFKQTLVSSGWWDRALVVLLSDHGESLGEHGESSHGYFIYQSTLRVPLMVHWPASVQSYRTHADDPAGLIDVSPTILDLLHLPIPASFVGRSLIGNPGAHAVYAESVHAHDAFGWAPLHSLRFGAYKYIDAPRPELYNLAADPRERTNLVAKEPSRAHEMQGQLARLLARYAPKHPGSPGDVSPRTRALLASLGYLSAGPRPASANSGPDPKDRLSEFRQYETSQILLYQRRLDEAIAVLRQLLAKDPNNTLARRDLGSCYVEEHRYADARPCFERVLSVVPGDYVAQYELGLVYERLGQYKEALEHFEAACKIAPESTQAHHQLEALQRKMK